MADFAVEIIDGDRSSNYPKEGDFVDFGIPFLNTTNIQDWRLDLSELRFVSQKKADGISKGKVKPRDIIMTTRGTIGRLARFDCEFATAIINAQMLILRAHPESVDPDFLFYTLRSDQVQSSIRGFSSGSAQPQIPIRDLKRIPIRLPDISEQRRAASILCAYDNLIDTNHRRIAVLESMARGLFEEWFVRFRYPGHENQQITNATDGPIPDGWHWAQFGDVAAEIRNPVLPANVLPETRYIGLEHIPRRSITLNDFGRAKDVASLKLRFERGDVLFGKIRPYFHKVAWAPYSGVSSSDAIIYRARNSVDSTFVLLVASSDRFVAQAVQTSNGTKMPRANPSVLKAYRIASAPQAISKQFHAIAGPMIELAASLQVANERLAVARDLLLPRLISGELSISSAKRELEAAA